MPIYDFKIFDSTRFDRAPKVYLFRTRRDRLKIVFGARSETPSWEDSKRHPGRTCRSILEKEECLFDSLRTALISNFLPLPGGSIRRGFFVCFFRGRSMTAVYPRHAGRTASRIFTSIILCRSRTITRIEFNRPNTVSSSNSQAQRPKYLADSSPISFLHLAYPAFQRSNTREPSLIIVRLTLVSNLRAKHTPSNCCRPFRGVFFWITVHRSVYRLV